MSETSHHVALRGVGWLDGQALGCVFQRQHATYGAGGGDPPWKQADLFTGAVKNMGRFDRLTRMTLCACALALKDAGVSRGEWQGGDIGVIGTNDAGSLEPNRAYFQDYLGAGRVLARGNLFIYTLPSSSLAETAIHFELKGPLLYAGFPGGGLRDLLESGADLIVDGAAAGMLAVKGDEQDAMAFLLGRSDHAGTDSYRIARQICASSSGDERAGGLALRLERALEGSGGV